MSLSIRRVSNFPYLQIFIEFCSSHHSVAHCSLMTDDESNNHTIRTNDVNMTKWESASIMRWWIWIKTYWYFRCVCVGWEIGKQHQIICCSSTWWKLFSSLRLFDFKSNRQYSRINCILHNMLFLIDSRAYLNIILSSSHTASPISTRPPTPTSLPKKKNWDSTPSHNPYCTTHFPFILAHKNSFPYFDVPL